MSLHTEQIPVQRGASPAIIIVKLKFGREIERSQYKLWPLKHSYKNRPDLEKAPTYSPRFFRQINYWARNTDLSTPLCRPREIEHYSFVALYLSALRACFWRLNLSLLSPVIGVAKGRMCIATR